mmetsp:Transcript_16771/g.52852  ORF Transcript_16771/g.52852 Transcript_16771/m.52852 type:complete len:202 (+) Transcript_16771:2016-2621(+)
MRAVRAVQRGRSRAWRLLLLRGLLAAHGPRRRRAGGGGRGRCRRRQGGPGACLAQHLQGDVVHRLRGKDCPWGVGRGQPVVLRRLLGQVAGRFPLRGLLRRRRWRRPHGRRHRPHGHRDWHGGHGHRERLRQLQRRVERLRSLKLQGVHSLLVGLSSIATLWMLNGPSGPRTRAGLEVFRMTAGRGSYAASFRGAYVSLSR